MQGLEAPPPEVISLVSHATQVLHPCLHLHPTLHLHPAPPSCTSTPTPCTLHPRPQDRLKGLVSKLSVIAEHRLDIIKTEGPYEVTQVTSWIFKKDFF